MLGEECDDDNADSHDGCSDQCEVEEHFECGGEPSNCSFVGNLSGQILSAERDGCNDLKI